MAEEFAADVEAARTVRSIAAMLGWLNVPPRSTLEADVRALKARAARQGGWQPIDTAPKDGTRLMLYGLEFRRHWFGVGYYFKGVPGDGEGWIAHSFLTLPDNDSSGCFTPTHWMPLPEPPVA